MPDTYSATWVSHSSIADFLACPRAYYLKNVYKDPKTGHKVQIMTAPLALGSAVHEVIESLSVLPLESRFSTSLLEKFDLAWKKLSGKRGGFHTPEHEQRYRLEGEEMLRNVMENPGPLKERAVKIKVDLPHYWLSETDNIILCGKIDWLQYLPESDSVHIIDFKTSKAEVERASLQLPIYHLLVHNTQRRTVSGASYWYLRQKNGLVTKELPDLQAAHEQVLEIAKRVRLQRKLGIFKCPQGEAGCFACRPMEQILRGDAEYVGLNDYKQDVYVLPSKSAAETEFDSEVL